LSPSNTLFVVTFANLFLCYFTWQRVQNKPHLCTKNTRCNH